MKARIPLEGGSIIARPILEQDFRLEIEGIDPGAFALVRSVEVDPIVIPAISSTTGEGSVAYGSFSPGPPEYGRITLRVTRTSAVDPLVDWWNTAISTGNLVQRNVTLKLVDSRSNNDEVRRWEFFDAVPVAYSPLGDGFDSSTTGQAIISMTLEFASVRITDSTGNDQQALMQLLDQQIAGISSGVIESISLTEFDEASEPTQTFTYEDAFITRYVFPVFDAGSPEPMIEEFQFKPTGFNQ